jgi:uncharacterized protein YqjF (DUF2071 family)
MGLPGRFLTAEWRWLAMLNYEADPALLAALAPQGTELDTFNNRTYLSMVGFLFLRTRVMGMRIPLHENFEEVNLRFYVRRKGPEGWRRGVVFIKEIVPRTAIAATARAFYNENYIALPMSHEAGSAKAVYRWRHRSRWHSLSVITTGEAHEAGAGSEEEFITEHYWGYSRQRDGGTIEYRVDHPRWRIWQAAAATFSCDVASLYGPEFAGILSRVPSSAFLADGSSVMVNRGTRLR